MPARHATKTLSPAKVKALKTLASRVDEREAREIKARGRAVFDQDQRIRQFVQQLKTERRRQGLSLSALALLTGIAKPNLSRVENGRGPTPSLDTLQRYARALGKTVEVKLADAA